MALRQIHYPAVAWQFMSKAESKTVLQVFQIIVYGFQKYLRAIHLPIKV